MTPLRQAVGTIEPGLESLYEDLDTYIKELDNTESLTFDIANTLTTHSPDQLSMSFKVQNDIPIPSAIVIEEEEDSNSSGIDTSISTDSMSRQDSWKSNPSSVIQTKRLGIKSTTIPLLLKLSLNDSNEKEENAKSVACISELSKQFVYNIKELCKSRSIFCSTEYPNSFAGEEAVDILHYILSNDWTRKEYKRIAKSFMHCVPPLFLPVAYADKSLKNNTLYDSPNEAYTLTKETEAAEEEDMTYSQGLIVPLMDCYTPSCVKGSSNGCYAPKCPNRGTGTTPYQLFPKNNIINRELQRHISLSSSLASSQETTSTFVSRCWSTTVSREMLQKTPPKEMKRQEAIYELIYTEEDYVRDLNLLDELFAKPLLTAQCLDPQRREDFCKEVFGNYMTIVDLHRNMYRELRDHQLTSLEEGQQLGFVDEIGMIFLKYVDQFMQAYTQYGPQFVLAEHAVKQEMTHNILFHNFIREKEKQAETRKLPFRHFIILPITRLQRYPLLLDAILKRSTKDIEKENLTKCIETIKSVAKMMDDLTSEKKKTLQLQQINEKIKFKPGSQQKLDLLKPGRQLIYEGTLKRRSHLVGESVELYVFLFDHLFLMTKPTKINGRVESYTVSKNPIPLDLLVVNDVAENFIYNTIKSAAKSSGATMTISSLKSASATSSSTFTNNASFDPSSQYINQSSLMIQHLGRYGGEYILYTDTPSSRYVWKDKILNAQNALKAREQVKNVFKMSTISEKTPALGKATCAASFVGENKQQMVVLGTQNGIYMGKESDTNGMKMVLMISDVTQIGVLQAENILLVLADKVLTAYSIAQIDPYALKTTKKVVKNTISNRVIANHISFFNTGVCNERTLIVTMRRKAADSHFKAYEPVCGDLKDSKNAKYLTTKTSFMSKPPAWFKIYKEFYIGTDSSAVHFLKSKVLVACSRGFEVIDLERLQDIGNSFPDLHHRDYQFIVNTEAKPISLFRCNEKNFLLCYDKFAFLMSTHGDYVRDKYKRIEWISNPHSVAFYHPYLLAFDARFIEIRHAETGKLVQIISGENTRYLPSSLNNANTVNSSIYCSSTTNQSIKSDSQNVFKLDPLL